MDYIKLTRTLICFGLSFSFIFFHLLLMPSFTLFVRWVGYVEAVLICGARNEGFTTSIEPARNNMKHYCCIFYPTGGIIRQYVK